MKAILRREYFALKHNFVSYISIWALLPMMVYLLISIPLSFYINLDNGINYLNWSSIGNWIFTSCTMSYVLSIKLSSNYILSDSHSKSLLYSSLSNYYHLLSIVLWSLFVGFIQLIFSLLITLTLNSSNLFFIDIVLVVIYILPIILLSSVLGIFIGFIIPDRLLRTISSIIIFLLLAFSSGLFVPLNPEISNIFLLSPIYLSVINIQSIITNDPSTVFASVIVLVVSVILFLINLALSYKVLRS